MVILTLSFFTPGERSVGQDTHYTGGRVGIRASLEAVKNNILKEIFEH
jgi:hypothetical protein